MHHRTLSHRHILAGTGGLAAAAILRWPAEAAEFSYKLGSSSPMEHPAMANSKKAADRIKQATNGRLDISIYPNSVLGGDTAMIAQTISGAMEMYILPIDLLAPRNPACACAASSSPYQA
ncbi:MAG TPA: TRAP transporter substrate-binding protein DctP [Acetobacteraceae bacterium]|nr:TRAP transporter substrate-binding protein DctP [Acetobacteraceae bacterium]